MAKNIVFLADGTWNGPKGADGDDTSPTNVLKLFSNLRGLPTLDTIALRDEQERVARDDDGSMIQCAKYLHGVGDSNNPLVKLLGGSFGAGIVERIVRGYTFISRNYQSGDRIYLVGFSRGAYTARALGGLICRVGLLNAALLGQLQDKELAYRFGLAAWAAYREGAGKNIGMIERIISGEAEKLPADKFIQCIPIKAIGVWDTVGSLGIPRYSGGGRTDIFQFADNKLSASVASGFHAVSIHEQRADFSPTLWDPRDDGTIEENWFAGAHADVGGGYSRDECRLSDYGLGWMTEKLQNAGLLVERFGAYIPNGDTLAKIHEPWNEPVWHALGKSKRAMPAGAVIHPSATAFGNP